MAEGKIVRRGQYVETPVTYITATVESGVANYSFTIQENTQVESATTTISLNDFDTSTVISLVSNTDILFNNTNYNRIQFYDNTGTRIFTQEWTTSGQGVSPLSYTPPANAVSFTVHADHRSTEFRKITTAQFQTLVVSYNAGVETNTYQADGKTYKSHTFKSSGTFTVSSLSNDSLKNEVDYLIIAGGGGAGADHAGGGGAGGYRTTNGTSGANSSAESKVAVTAQSYTITVGAGGTFVTTGQAGNNGANSSALGITSIGGGGGAGSGAGGRNGGNGGSGGGSSRNAANGTPGTGTSGQGTNGANGQEGSPAIGGGGGGGAGVAGAVPSGTVAGFGGNGLSNILRTGSAETRAGGGGGGSYNGTAGGTGGTGGGGNGGTSSAGAQNATANTGSGGGGAGQVAIGGKPGNGGSGIVIIRYEIAPA